MRWMECFKQYLRNSWVFSPVTICCMYGSCIGRMTSDLTTALNMAGQLSPAFYASIWSLDVIIRWSFLFWALNAYWYVLSNSLSRSARSTFAKGLALSTEISIYGGHGRRGNRA